LDSIGELTPLTQKVTSNLIA